jgi:hypothetical protein
MAPTRLDGGFWLARATNLGGTGKRPTGTAPELTGAGPGSILGLNQANRTNGNYLLFLPVFLPRAAFEARSTTLSALNGKADDGSRTRDLELGKLALYQLSYVRVLKFLIPEPF